MREKIENILRNQELDRNKLGMARKEQILPHNTVPCSGNETLELLQNTELKFTGSIRVFLITHKACLGPFLLFCTMPYNISL